MEPFGKQFWHLPAFALPQKHGTHYQVLSLLLKPRKPCYARKLARPNGVLCKLNVSSNLSPFKQKKALKKFKRRILGLCAKISSPFELRRTQMKGYVAEIMKTYMQSTHSRALHISHMPCMCSLLRRRVKMRLRRGFENYPRQKHIEYATSGVTFRNEASGVFCARSHSSARLYSHFQ